MSEGHHFVRRTLSLLAAGANPLDINDVKAQLRVESDDDDVLIQALMDAAQNQLDGRDGRLGRALLTQKWRMQQERFAWYPFPYAGAPYDEAMVSRDWAFDPWKYRRLFAIKMPLPPLVSIEAFSYTDPSYVTHNLVLNTDYRIVAGGGGESLVLPMVNTTWPATAIEPDAVTIDFTCGYATAALLAVERKAVLQVMKLLVALWYKEREAALVANRAAQVELPYGVEALLAPHKLHWF